MAKNGKKGKSGGSREVLVVGSKVKDAVKSAGCRSDGSLIGAVSDKVHDLVKQAVERAKQNGRSTVRPVDL